VGSLSLNTTRWPHGDTLMRLGGASAWFRPPVHDATPPSLYGVREGPFPRFHTVL